MKKLLLITGLFLLVGFSLHAQQKSSLSFFTYGAAAATLEVKATDVVSAIYIRVPEAATDSVEVWGNAKTIGAKAATKTTYGAGEGVAIGDGKTIINYVYLVIRAGSRAQITTATPISK